MQTDVPKASEMGHSIFIPRAVTTLVILCPNSVKGNNSSSPFGVNFQERWNSTLSAFPKVAGDVRGPGSG